MDNNQKIYEKLKEQYSAEELADSLLLPEELTEAEEKKVRAEFLEMRLAKRQQRSAQEKMFSGLLSIKYQVKSYLEAPSFEEDKSLAHFLNKYLEVVNRNQKTLAEEIDVHPSRLNRILKGKEKIGKSIAYRLEMHSGDLIPAIYWWKLMQKEVEQEILTEQEERALEKKHVKVVAYRA